MANMHKSRPVPPDVTPSGHLSEASLHLVMGYQLAQATIVTDAVFAQRVGLPFDLRPVEFTVLPGIASISPSVNTQSLDSRRQVSSRHF